MLQFAKPHPVKPPAPQKNAAKFPRLGDKLPLSPLQNLRPQKTRELPFPKPVRERMENTFRTDFSAMRFYESPTPAALRAKALTSGNQSFFSPGCFSPHSESGLRLIGHELSHAAAQSRGVGTSGKSCILYSAGLEAQAEQEGRQAAHGDPIQRATAWSSVRPLPNAPHQGYFTLLPGDYVLQSDGTKAPFATHAYHSVPATNDPSLVDFEQEFSFPDPFMLPQDQHLVPDDPFYGMDFDEEPSSEAQRFPLFARLKKIDLAPAPRSQREAAAMASERLRAHRTISDAFSNELGSHNPSFQQSISRDPISKEDRYAAIGVHRYTGKVALYVADDGAFAVNAQTPEPKEAYVRSDKVDEVRVARPESNIRLHFFGNRLQVPLPTGVTVDLIMMRPYFDGSYQGARTTVCSEFAQLVAPHCSTSNIDSENQLAKKRLYSKIDCKAAVSRLSDILTRLVCQFPPDFQSASTNPTRVRRDMQKKVSPVFKEFSTSLKRANEANDINDCFRDFEEMVRVLLKGAMQRPLSVEGYTVSPAYLDNNPVNHAVPAKAGLPVSINRLQNFARSAMENEFWKAHFLEMDRLIDQVFGWSGGVWHAPEDDVRRVSTESTTKKERERAKRHGINSFAVPDVGQAYKITPVVGHGWEYHFASVVAASAGDRLTLENYNKKAELSALKLVFAREQMELIASIPESSEELPLKLSALAAKQNEKLSFYNHELLKTWYFAIQGINRIGQSFHEKQDATGAYGFRSTTIVR